MRYSLLNLLATLSTLVGLSHTDGLLKAQDDTSLQITSRLISLVNTTLPAYNVALSKVNKVVSGLKGRDRHCHSMGCDLGASGGSRCDCVDMNE